MMIERSWVTKASGSPRRRCGYRCSVGHGASINIETGRKLSADEARQILADFPGVTVLDAANPDNARHDPWERTYPTPEDLRPMAAGIWFEKALRHHGLAEVPVNGAIACRSAGLPPLHNDACDRIIIIATALEHGMSIVTCDALISQYEGVAVLW